MHWPLIMEQLLVTKSRLGSEAATPMDHALIELGLSSAEPRVQLISAAICIAQQESAYEEISYRIIEKTLDTQNLQGRFATLLFWESMLNVDLRRIDISKLIALITASLSDPHADRLNIAALLRKLRLYGIVESIELLKAYET
jgi:hypothetical protein